MTDRLDDLERRLKRLEETLFPNPAPYGPLPWTPQPIPWLPPASTAPTCPKCGIKFEGAWGYLCPAMDCPIQLRAT